MTSSSEKGRKNIGKRRQGKRKKKREGWVGEGKKKRGEGWVGENKKEGGVGGARDDVIEKKIIIK